MCLRDLNPQPYPIQGYAHPVELKHCCLTYHEVPTSVHSYLCRYKVEHYVHYFQYLYLLAGFTIMAIQPHPFNLVYRLRIATLTLDLPFTHRTRML